MGIDENPDSKVVLVKKVGHYISNPLIAPLARVWLKKGENEELWRDGLEQLKTWDSVKLDGMDEVLIRLQICYDDLKDDEQKVCFLYGALYPEESEIHVDYLLECWKAEGFIGSASVFRRARWSGHRVLNELIKVSLLERSDKSKCVKMNNMFRKMALRISSQRFEDFPKKEEWEQASRISLMKSRLRTLPETLNCSHLLTLLLQVISFAQILESIDHPSHNILKLANGADVNPIIMKVLMKTDALGLIDYKGVSSLSDFGIENMHGLSNCLIKGCSKIKTIIDGDRVSEVVLQSLENLHITNVPNLENIWQGPVQARSLSQLTTVTLSKCPNLMVIFSKDLIQGLLQLKHLRVEECCQIKEIIMESEITQLENQTLRS
ncbi:hypothetical protein AAG906_014850 [Vitis piasezkii]